MAWQDLRSCNPWVRLRVDPPGPPYILEEDVAVVERFNEAPRRHRNHVLQLSVLPEPFVGCPEAPIWLLNLNPGFGGGEHAHDPIVHERQARALKLDNDRFWMLDEAVDHSGAFAWWSRTLGSPLRDVGRVRTQSSFFCIELFGYHSVKGPKGFHCPSQEFSFRLVARACEEGKVFVIMRAQKAWMAAVPALGNLGQDRIARVKNWQRPTISPNNVEHWDLVRDNLV